MLKIRIHGIEDGVHDVDLESDAGKIEGLFKEFFGKVKLRGKLRKLGKRYAFTGTAECMAGLICDLSLKEYEELITAEVKLSFLADTDLYLLKGKDDVKESEEFIVHEDEQYVDISRIVSEMLDVSLPMKKVAPEYRDKEFEDIFPEFSAEKAKEEGENERESDDRWNALKNLKLN